jgi:hypothetical protein
MCTHVVRITACIYGRQNITHYLHKLLQSITIDPNFSPKQNLRICSHKLQLKLVNNKIYHSSWLSTLNKLLYNCMNFYIRHQSNDQSYYFRNDLFSFMNSIDRVCQSLILNTTLCIQDYQQMLVW